MRIIGKTKDGFVLTATADEVANLAGYYGSYSQRREAAAGAVGSTVNVAAMFTHLYRLGQAKREIQSMADKLRTAADLLDALPEPITEAEAKPDEEEDGMTIYQMLHMLMEIVLFGSLVGLLVGFCGAAVWSAWMRSAEKRWRREVIDREMASAPPEPVHPDVHELLIERDERGGRPPETGGEKAAVRAVIDRIERE